MRLKIVVLAVSAACIAGTFFGVRYYKQSAYPVLQIINCGDYELQDRPDISSEFSRLVSLCEKPREFTWNTGLNVGENLLFWRSIYADRNLTRGSYPILSINQAPDEYVPDAEGMYQLSAFVNMTRETCDDGQCIADIVSQRIANSDVTSPVYRVQGVTWVPVYCKTGDNETVSISEYLNMQTGDASSSRDQLPLEHCSSPCFSFEACKTELISIPQRSK
ncbi:hypothetical protein [Halocynthiibacter styelae]|uniref:Uncharacterized protein n=1 Tax=Halocynthiibacter styelae TaxID=2761955 RepID=A0A8J7LKT3_9RHOB|nr:hypothetical protein [Paenihalocynthiibacter styelae]MBI1493254.1 hypothetical protein [Paenihalocynthiibacter styelae]